MIIRVLGTVKVSLATLRTTMAARTKPQEIHLTPQDRQPRGGPLEYRPKVERVPRMASNPRTTMLRRSECQKGDV
jgi:hypothetical protein